MRKIRRSVALCAAALCISAVAGATTVTYNSGTNPAAIDIPNRSTNFTNINVAVPYFDASALCNSGFVCTLNSVFISLTGNVSSNARFENLDAASITVSTDVAANVALSRPNGTLIVVTLPEATSSTNVSAFDGLIDFAGDSGRTLPTLGNVNSQSTTLTSLADLTLFTGSGLLYLPVSGSATSSAYGSGNLITHFLTQVGAGVSVTYDYTVVTAAVSTTPEPATFAMLGCALVGVGLLRRRRAR